MSQHTDLLKHDAELILSLFGNESAQKKRLLSIEQQLAVEDVDISSLHQNLSRLNEAHEPAQYRCSYQMQD